MEQTREKVLKFSLLQGFFFSSWATFVSFSVYYLLEMGYSNTQIGLIMSTRTLMEIIGQPVIGYICDLKKTNKKVFIISYSILILIVVAFPLYNNIVLITIAMAIFGFIFSPQQSILDSWIMESSPELARRYGFMRAWGSIGFAVTVIGTGQLIDKIGWNIIFFGFALLSLITIGIAFLNEDKSGKRTDMLEAAGIAVSDRELNPFKLFRNREFLFLLIISLIIFIPNQTVFIFLATIIKHLGGSPSYQGYILFFSALSEAPIFFLAASLLKRYKPRKLLLVSAFFYLIRLIIVARATTPVYLIYFGILQSMSFALFLPTARYYINLIIPEGLKTTAQTLLTTFCFGLGGVIASSLGGFAIDTYGLELVFRICILLTITAILLLIISIYFKDIIFRERDFEEQERMN